jgi:hypothetical protein
MMLQDAPTSERSWMIRSKSRSERRSLALNRPWGKRSGRCQAIAAQERDAVPAAGKLEGSRVERRRKMGVATE